MSRARRILTSIVGTLAVLLLIVGLVYLAVQCQHIPAPLPGREAGSTRHRIGYAAAALVLAVVVAGAALAIARPRSNAR